MVMVFLVASIQHNTRFLFNFERMNTLLKTSTFFLILVGLLACEKTEKVDSYPKHESKLAVNCFFFPDTFIKVRLSKSLSPLDNAPFSFLNSNKAIIRIYENNLLFDSLKFITLYYAGNRSKTPKANNTYRIECLYPGFDIVSAEDYIPDTVKVTSAKGYNTILNSYQGTDSTLYCDFNTNITLNIQGLSTLNKYMIIRILPFNANQKMTKNLYPFYSNVWSHPVSEISGLNEAEFIDYALYVSNTEGIKQLILNLDWNYTFLNKSKPTYRYQINIQTCSESAFEYLRRSALQMENQNDPFSQPTQISNNIKNGYGVFGGINGQSYYITL